MELFVRLIGRQKAIEKEGSTLVGVHVEAVASNAFSTKPTQQQSLSKRIALHMEATNDYRNPDLSLAMLAAALFTNRTTLALALHELGYPSFNAYVNTLRIEDFIRRIRNKVSTNYQEAFYDAGFRSRATALRNFKHYTGKTPSAYFQVEQGVQHVDK